MNSHVKMRVLAPEEAQKIGSELAASFARLCVPAHRYTVVQAKEFNGLDLRWYERAGNTLRGFGYRLIADVQTDAPVSPDFLPGFLRLALSADGASLAIISHVVQHRGLRLRNFFRTWAWDAGDHNVTLLTEFSDGSFCQTSTGLQQYDVEAGFVEQYLPPDVSIQRVLSRHKQMLLRYMRDHAEQTPQRLERLDDLIATLNRAQAKRAEARRARGCFTEVELWRLGYAPTLARQLIGEVSHQRELVAGV